MKFKSIKEVKEVKEVKEANEAIGSYFFSSKNMKFFESSVESKLIDGKFFVTREITFDGLNMAYTIREVDDKGNIETVGDMCKYSTLKSALDAIKFIRKARVHD